ncbi:MAG: polysaccharide deacetylase family protein [Sphingobacteriaceae bacterium]
MILLSFDIEEFDMPLEYQTIIEFKDQIEISRKGTNYILDILKKHGIKATFFSTARFAEEVPEIIERIKNEHHELASHTYYHSSFEESHLLVSKQKLEELSGMKVNGLRMPRMRDVNPEAVYQAGYEYNSSLNPTYLPGRYNHFSKPRTYFKQEKLWQIPASVSPAFRLPLFWLSFHNLPLSYYQYLCRKTYKKDGYLNLYFHPWEFTDLRNKEKFGLPAYVSRNSGDAMISRMDQFIDQMLKRKYTFGTFSSFIKKI